MGTIQPPSRPECLYIIGNGFDLHYGIKSSYLDYLAYPNEHDSALSGLLEEVCPGDIWKNFESALGALAPGSLFTNTFNLIIPDSDSEYEWEQRSASWNYHLQAMEKTQPEKDSGTFSAWVSKIDTADRAHDDGLIENTSDAVYLTFNYTKVQLHENPRGSTRYRSREDTAHPRHRGGIRSCFRTLSGQLRRKFILATEKPARLLIFLHRE